MKSEYEHGERFDIEDDNGRVGVAAVGFDFDSVCQAVDGEELHSEHESKNAARLAVYKTLELIVGPGKRKAYRPTTIANRVITLSLMLGVIRGKRAKDLAFEIGLTPQCICEEKKRIRRILSGR